MKNVNMILAIILLTVTTGCGERKHSTYDVITVDVTKRYLKKELILQDFMDVEYIALETTDEFLTQGVVMAVGKEIVIVKNRINDGDIFIFDRAGKGIRKINRKGQGGEEYNYSSEIVLDEDSNEMFIIDSQARKIQVYDLFGKFKRSFNFSDTSNYSSIFNFNKDNLISYKSYKSTEGEQPCFLIVSKQDGNITREIRIPLKRIIKPIVTTVINGIDNYAETYLHQIIPYFGNFLLVEASSDTVFSYLSDGTLIPFIIRTPSIHFMDPEVFLHPCVLTNHYYFIQSIKKTFDFEKGFGFPVTNLVFDKQENALFEPTVYNDDFTTQIRVGMWSNSVNHEIATFQIIEAYQLVDDYKEGRLKDGKLKEIASKLDEEDNPVIMLIKHKK